MRVSSGQKHSLLEIVINNHANDIKRVICRTPLGKLLRISKRVFWGVRRRCIERRRRLSGWVVAVEYIELAKFKNLHDPRDLFLLLIEETKTQSSGSQW